MKKFKEYLKVIGIYSLITVVAIVSSIFFSVVLWFVFGLYDISDLLALFE